MILVFCLTACGGSDSKNLQERNDTTVYENMTSEAEVESQNDNNISDEYMMITATIENFKRMKLLSFLYEELDRFQFGQL